MLTILTLNKIRTAGFSVADAQRAFVDAIKDACIELGGQTWQAGDVADLFRRIAKEIKPMLCTAADGPKLSATIFADYMSGAEKALLFGIPFSLRRKVPRNKLARVKSLVDADTSAKSQEQKILAAVQSLKDKDKPHAPALALPLPGSLSDSDYVAELFESISLIFGHEKVKEMSKNHLSLKLLWKLCQRASQEALEAEINKEVAA